MRVEALQPLLVVSSALKLSRKDFDFLKANLFGKWVKSKLEMVRCKLDFDSFTL